MGAGSFTIDAGITLSAGATTIQSPISQSFSGALSPSNTGTLFAAVAAPADVGVTLVNESNIGISGSISQTLLSGDAGSTSPSYLVGVALYGTDDTLANYGTIAATAAGLVSSTFSTVQGGKNETLISNALNAPFGVSAYGGLLVNHANAVITASGDAVYLGNGRDETISNAGTIAGSYVAPVISSRITIIGDSTVTTAVTLGGTYGIGIFAGGVKTDSSIGNTATISGSTGIEIVAGSATIDNSGIIIGHGGSIAAADGFGIQGIGQAAGSVETSPGTYTQVLDTLDVSNSGTIMGAGDSGAAAYGIELLQGFISNSILGVIEGTSSAIYARGSYTVTIENAGTIATTGTSSAISLVNGTVADSGIITGGITFTGSTALLELETGAEISGSVGAGGTGELELAAGSGSFNMGDSFTGFDSIAFAAGAEWDIAGTYSAFTTGQTISGFNGGDTITLDGFAETSETLVAGATSSTLVLTEGGTTVDLDFAGSITAGQLTITSDGANSTITSANVVSSGTVNVGAGSVASNVDILSGAVVSVQNGGTVSNPMIAGGTLSIEAGASIVGEISFSSAGGQLLIDAGAAVPSNVIAGFAPGDSIKLAGVPYDPSDTVEVLTPGVVTIDADGTDYDLNIAGAYVGETGFSLSSDLLLTTENAMCYLRGTRIVTPTGERPVEDLRPGDEVVTRRSGIARLKWIGRQGYAGHFLTRNTEKLPVCIKPGALGENLPRRELFVSPGHSLLIGDVLVLAKNLVNGITIIQEEAQEIVEYHALELAEHDCVMAEGTWGESFADGPGLRAAFHNAAGYFARHPDYVEPPIEKLCAPRPQHGPELAKALTPVLARAAALAAPARLHGWVESIGADGMVTGWAQDQANPELPVWVEICAGERVIGRALACDYRGDLAEAGIGKGRALFSFMLDDGAGHAAITVRFANGEELPRTEDCIQRAA